ncbi:MAG: metal-dependent transcriptional regulator [Spirochaetia bacterium]|nr:metal-dependent transcriptional regulator [Spirochaetia bacterium]
MKMYESSEMYLETIHVLHMQSDTVKAVEIAHHMGFSKASVSVAVHGLEEHGYIRISSDGNISLTDKGEAVARRIYERHVIIGSFFEMLGVDHDTAYADACKIEHDISEETFIKLKEHLNSIKTSI